MKRPNNNKKDNKDYVKVNHQIRCLNVRVVKDKEQLGIMSTEKARRLAQQYGLDLVEVAPNADPPVCQISDFKKFKWQREQKKKEDRKKQKSTEMKELRLSPSIDDHDIDTKVKIISKFIGGGKKVKLNLLYKSRQLAHKDRGFEVMNRFITSLEDIAKVEKAPKLESHNRLTCILEPKE